MAIKNYKTQVALFGKSGLAEDRYINTWHCCADDSAEIANLTDWHNAVLDFYLESADGINAPWGFLSNVIRTNDHTITTYDLTDATPRVPVLTDSFDLPGSLTVEGYPSQVALVCSFRSLITSGVNAARRRNRIYFGPLKNTVGDFDVSSIRPLPAVISSMCANMEALQEASEAAEGAWSWIAHSDLDPLANAGRAVVAGWVDNRFDTQRRRLEPATSRQNWPA